MMRKLMGAVWRGAPAGVRRWGVWLTQPRFAVTAGAVVEDERGRVLLLKHVFRKGSGWGIPGGFLARGEDAEVALRREVREETGAELDRAEIVFTRTLARPQQVEVIFRCRMPADRVGDETQSFEIRRAGWFERGELPGGLSADQRRLIERALGGGAKPPG